MKKIISGWLIMILLVSGAFSLSEIQVNATSKTMYVTASALNVRQSATVNSKVLTSVKQNAALTVFQTKGSWSQVKANGKTGWVSTKHLIPLFIVNGS